MFKSLINYLLPTTCLVCHFKSAIPVCQDCVTLLPWLKQGCKTCAKELMSACSVDQCGECLIDPPAFSRVVILFQYLSPISSLIRQLKFQHQLSYAKTLGNLLAEHIGKVYSQANLPLPQCIIPVPLHPSRLRERGYNQAVEIARPIKKLLNIRLDFTSVKRVVATAPQTLTPAHDRHRNVKNIFVAHTHFTEEHVAIVDDVVTTFSTLVELAKVLKKQGVSKIDVWCLAKS